MTADTTQARLAVLTGALDKLCNGFAWSAVTADCEEARANLQSLIDAGRAALASTGTAERDVRQWDEALAFGLRTDADRLQMRIDRGRETVGISPFFAQEIVAFMRKAADLIDPEEAPGHLAPIAGQDVIDAAVRRYKALGAAEEARTYVAQSAAERAVDLAEEQLSNAVTRLLASRQREEEGR